jgi:hypothetical protein
VVVREVSYAQASSLPKENPSLDPMSFYRIDEKLGMLPMGLREGRAVWRDSSSLFALREGAKDRDTRPFAFVQVGELYNRGVLGGTEGLECSVYGIANDKAKALLWRQEQLPVPHELIKSPETAQILVVGLEICEEVGWVVRAATHALAAALLKEDPKSADKNTVGQLASNLGAESLYWSTMEPPFRSFLLGLVDDSDKALAEWTTTCKRNARAAFEQVSINSLGRGAKEMRARVRAGGVLEGRLKELQQQANGGQP